MSLSDLDHWILSELEAAHAEGLVLSSDIAYALKCGQRDVAQRLPLLRDLGLAESQLLPNTHLYGWAITHEGIQLGPWSPAT